METYFDEEKHIYTVDGLEVPSVTEICSPLTGIKYDTDMAALRLAKARGTAVHEATEYDDLGCLYEEDIDFQYVDYINAWREFKRDYNPTMLMSEFQMFSYDFAGTCDRIANIDGCTVLIDIKTTSSMDRLSKLSLVTQLYGYSVLCAEYGVGINLNNSIGVQLKKDGTYTVHNYKAICEKYGYDPEDEFKYLLHLNKIVRGDTE